MWPLEYFRYICVHVRECTLSRVTTLIIPLLKLFREYYYIITKCRVILMSIIVTMMMVTILVMIIITVQDVQFSKFYRISVFQIRFNMKKMYTLFIYLLKCFLHNLFHSLCCLSLCVTIYGLIVSVRQRLALKSCAAPVPLPFVLRKFTLIINNILLQIFSHRVLQRFVILQIHYVNQRNL